MKKFDIQCKKCILSWFVVCSIVLATRRDWKLHLSRECRSDNFCTAGTGTLSFHFVVKRRLYEHCKAVFPKNQRLFSYEMQFEFVEQNYFEASSHPESVPNKLFVGLVYAFDSTEWKWFYSVWLEFSYFFFLPPATFSCADCLAALSLAVKIQIIWILFRIVRALWSSFPPKINDYFPKRICRVDCAFWSFQPPWICAIVWSVHFW